MQIPYCLPIIKKTKDEVLTMIQTHQEDYTFFEIWLDYIEHLDHEFVEGLSNELGDKLILLFRRQDLEPIRMSLGKRHSIIELLTYKKSLLDLDIRQQDELHYIQQQNIQVPMILSYHNYQETPSDEVLKDILASMKELHPTIYKIATQCKTNNDALRLLRLQLLLKQEHQRCIILGMGRNGIITRIFATLWGNEMTFAPQTRAEKSAPGQLAKDELEIIFTILNTESKV